jgi:hypothetical protein
MLCVRRFALILACILGVAQTDSRIPPEVRYKSRYINPVPKPADFASAMLWGIAIADTRVAGYANAEVDISRVQFSCRVEGKNVVLNDDRGDVRGGLYRRFPWFGTDAHDPMPIEYSSVRKSKGNASGSGAQDHNRSVLLRVGTNPDRVWHFWAASPRAAIPAGELAGCTVRIRAKISAGALLQVGFDYWRNPSIDFGPGGNNHEAGASDWYFPSKDWQEASFTNVKQ